jgi:prevent-host-death family protein
MRTISATEAKQNPGALLDTAQREPVVIRGHDRDVAVILLPREYDRLRAINLAEFDQFCDRIGARAAEQGLTGEELAALLDDDA